MTWVVTAYLPTETVSTALVGKSGDLFGQKVVLQVSAVVFITGSFLCGLASDMTPRSCGGPCRAWARAGSWSPRWR